jgi:hypothetical protein
MRFKTNMEHQKKANMLTAMSVRMWSSTKIKLSCHNGEILSISCLIGVATAYYDKSIFYAHDRRRKVWHHKDALAKPYAKREGVSMMVADYVSTDFGWLQSPDGKKSAQRTLKPGKNKEGYYTNEDIQEQVQVAMDILKEFYPEFDHVLIYDNASTHLKRKEDALSALKMPKNTHGLDTQ